MLHSIFMLRIYESHFCITSSSFASDSHEPGSYCFHPNKINEICHPDGGKRKQKNKTNNKIKNTYRDMSACRVL